MMASYFLTEKKTCDTTECSEGYWFGSFIQFDALVDMVNFQQSAAQLCCVEPALHIKVNVKVFLLNLKASVLARLEVEQGQGRLPGAR